MRWNWCEMCRFDGRCENQDRNIECACYAREQTLRAEQYGNLIDKQQKQLKIAIEALKDIERKLLTIDVSNLSSLDRDKLYDIMFHDGVIDKALDKIKKLDRS